MPWTCHFAFISIYFIVVDFYFYFYECQWNEWGKKVEAKTSWVDKLFIFTSLSLFCTAMPVGIISKEDDGFYDEISINNKEGGFVEIGIREILIKL